MNSRPVNSLPIYALLALTATATQTYASNGYFADGYSARNQAMAGSGTAMAQDSIAPAINPAGLVFVGDRTDLELELFSPFREYRVNGAPSMTSGSFPLQEGTVESDSNFFPLATLGWSKQLSAHQSIGLAMYGNGGMNTDYKPLANPLCAGLGGGNGSFCGGRTAMDMAQAFIVGTYAHSFDNGRYSLGISPIFAAQTFKLRGIGAFGSFSTDSNSLSDRGRDYSFGAGFRIGGQAELMPGVKLGASYKSRIYMSNFERYQGLFAQQGRFDIPDSFNVGLAWEMDDALTAAFDVEHIRYSEIKAVGTPMAALFQGAKLGAGNSPGFGWNDMTIYKFGLQWQQNADWIWRGGVSYGQQPIEGSEVMLNILAPGIQEWHLTGGFSYKLNKDDELSFSCMYSPRKTISGPNPMSPGQNVELSMEQFSLRLGWSWHF